ncbi:MAG: M20/M25/M40 family metallo-hydrolase, partial [Mycobacteriales bacterium]
RIEIDGLTHLRWTFGTPRVLVLGHLDTVWPLGTLDRWPFRVDGDVATGPGVFDMKAGAVQALHALSLLPSLDGICLLLNVDEEIGSPTSRSLILESVHGCTAALVCEPAAGLALKTARKGIGRYDVTVTGRAAHAGLEPEKGINATVGVAQAVLALSALGDPAAGTSVTPTVLSAGTTTNTVPASATVAVDVRAVLPSELSRVDTAVRGLCVPLEAAAVSVSGGINRPPLDASSSASLFALAQRLSPELQGIAVGGGSDGNFTAGAGVATLDGLGAVGAGAHAEGEHVLVSHMEPRAQLLAALLGELL